MVTALTGSVVVITGASSGIGRATALEFARRGATVVVAARRRAALDELAAQARALGAGALAVPVDVTDERAVQALADAAVERFGRLDVWVNNAAVTLFARFEEAPADAYRRVVETNLFGYVHGARAALRRFREQGRGVLINVGSLVGKLGMPYVSAYVATKWAIPGLTESLRQELRDAPHIHVASVLPASIDTPLFQHAANYTGRAVKPLRPVYDAHQVARAIVACAVAPARQTAVGAAGRLPVWLHALAPALYERLAPAVVERDHFGPEPAGPTPGNLFEPMPEWTTVSGGWRRSGARRAGGLAALGLAALGLAGWAGWRGGRARRLST